MTGRYLAGLNSPWCPCLDPLSRDLDPLSRDRAMSVPGSSETSPSNRVETRMRFRSPQPPYEYDERLLKVFRLILFFW